MNYFIFLIQELPKNIKIELINDNDLSSILVAINIIISIVVALFIRDHIEKKAKQYEVDAHIKKLKYEKMIKYCIDLNHTFTKICVKNPNIEPITIEEIEELNNKIQCEGKIFIKHKDLENIEKFRDYIIEIMSNSSKKKPLKEKSFFYLIKKIINE